MVPPSFFKQSFHKSYFQMERNPYIYFTKSIVIQSGLKHGASFVWLCGEACCIDCLAFYTVV